jgi:small ligand-binding sensory domain FIST
VPVVVGSGFSPAPAVGVAAADAAREAQAGLRGAACDLALVFVSGDLVTEAPEALRVVHEILDPGDVAGTTAGGLLAGGQELEQGDGVAVWAISLGDGARAEVFELHATEVEEGIALSGLPAGEIGVT